MKYGTEITNPSGEVLRRSKNLRGMCDYARVSHVVKVELVKGYDGSLVNGLLTVTYADGCTSRAVFNSYHIAVDFVRNRRSWRSADITMTDNVGYLTNPGILA